MKEQLYADVSRKWSAIKNNCRLVESIQAMIVGLFENAYFTSYFTCFRMSEDYLCTHLKQKFRSLIGTFSFDYKVYGRQ